MKRRLALRVFFSGLLVVGMLGCARQRMGFRLAESKTPLPEVAGLSRDPRLRTPLPVEMPEAAAHLPPGFVLSVPFEGRFQITNGYGYESESWTHRTISNTISANDFFALDFAMPVGTPVLAAADGRILTAQDRSELDSYGKYIVIDHGGGIHSIYAHLDTMKWEVDHGEPVIWVHRGQQIGTSGKSGGQSSPHLHFAVHTGSRISHSGCDVGGRATVPEPLGGFYGLRKGQWLRGERLSD